MFFSEGAENLGFLIVEPFNIERGFDFFCPAGGFEFSFMHRVLVFLIVLFRVYVGVERGKIFCQDLGVRFWRVCAVCGVIRVVGGLTYKEKILLGYSFCQGLFLGECYIRG